MPPYTSRNESRPYALPSVLSIRCSTCDGSRQSSRKGDKVLCVAARESDGEITCRASEFGECVSQRERTSNDGVGGHSESGV